MKEGGGGGGRKRRRQVEEEKEEEGLDVYEHTNSRPLCKIKFDLNENLSWPLYGRRRRRRKMKEQ